MIEEYIPEEVILVDENDKAIGTADKLIAHQQGLMHRAFSVFIFSKDYKFLLMQKRANNKYHSAGLWSNTCCSHPRPDEDTITAANRRLKEEMGIQAPLQRLFAFHYQVQFENGLIENEIDHVYVGSFKGDVSPDYKEVSHYQWMSIDTLKNMTESQYTYWFKLAWDKVSQHLLLY
jgi:isopentenyl-diphosphate delta-isomerase